MRKIILITLLFLYPEATAAAGTSDAVNERIPVRNDEMELHWQVDCRATWQQVRNMANSTNSCQGDPGILHDLKLCSFIYQPPGEEPDEQSPDYSSALAALHNNRCPAIP